jgi:hypothetical protein
MPKGIEEQRRMLLLQVPRKNMLETQWHHPFEPGLHSI